jgi:hypothetical protein
MTVPAKVAMFLRAKLDAYCDDCLGALLRLGWGKGCGNCGNGGVRGYRGRVGNSWQ